MEPDIMDVRAILVWRVRNGDPDRYHEWVEYARRTWPQEDIGFALSNERIDDMSNYMFTPGQDTWVKVGDKWTIKRPTKSSVARRKL